MRRKTNRDQQKELLARNLRQVPSSKFQSRRRTSTSSTTSINIGVQALTQPEYPADHQGPLTSSLLHVISAIEPTITTYSPLLPIRKSAGTSEQPHPVQHSRGRAAAKVDRGQQRDYEKDFHSQPPTTRHLCDFTLSRVGLPGPKQRTVKSISFHFLSPVYSVPVCLSASPIQKPEPTLENFFSTKLEHKRTS